MTPLGRSVDGLLSAVVALVIGAGLLLIGFGVALIGLFLYFCIVYAVTTARYEKYLEEEQQRFDEIVADVGANGKAEDVLRAVFDVRDYVNAGYETTSDWVIGNFFGSNQGKSR